MHVSSALGCSWILTLFPALVSAGPYSSGLPNTVAGAPDPAVPGFVGTSTVVNPAFSGWATSVQSYLPATGVDAGFNDPSLALGPVTGDQFDIVSLGEGTNGTAGQITLRFAGGIRDGRGADFAVFENGLGSDRSVFGELGFVQVSSDGQNFAQFPTVSLTAAAVGSYSTIDPTNVYNLAGKHVNNNGVSYGTPFDLSSLANDPSVASGSVKLNQIRYVRIVDVVGDGKTLDSLGNPIYDPFPTYGSAGFDLEAIGALNSWVIGDANFDGKVNIADLGILATDYGQSTTAGAAAGDFNDDGVVNIADLGLLATHYGTAVPSLASLPEPAMMLAVAIAGLLLFGRRTDTRIRYGALLLTLGTFVSRSNAATATLDDIPLAPNSYDNGSSGSGGFTSAGVKFQNTYYTQFGGYYSGFVLSDVSNSTKAGFTNQYAAYPGNGAGASANYAIDDVGGGEEMILPHAAVISSIDVTNTTYTYLAIRDGNDGSGTDNGFVRQFGETTKGSGKGNDGAPDYCYITITGHNATGTATGSVNFYLADYRFANNAQDYVVSNWTSVNLTSLGSVSSLSFDFTTTDTGQFGANTPSYFAMDNVTFVPEPGAVLLEIGVAFLRRRRKSDPCLAASLIARFAPTNPRATSRQNGDQ